MYTITANEKIIENKKCVVYGIRYDDVYYVNDISADRGTIERLVKDYNKYDLKPIHLHDEIEDFLFEL